MTLTSKLAIKNYFSCFHFHCHKPVISSAKLRNTKNREPAMNERASSSPNSSYKISYPQVQSVSATWKEAKESSVKSFTKRSIPLACSSVIKAKMTSWVPRSGISVSVDLASLRSQRKKKTMPLNRSLLIPIITTVSNTL